MASILSKLSANIIILRVDSLSAFGIWFQIKVSKVVPGTTVIIYYSIQKIIFLSILLPEIGYSEVKPYHIESFYRF